MHNSEIYGSVKQLAKQILPMIIMKLQIIETDDGNTARGPPLTKDL